MVIRRKNRDVEETGTDTEKTPLLNLVPLANDIIADLWVSDYPNLRFTNNVNATMLPDSQAIDEDSSNTSIANAFQLPAAPLLGKSCGNERRRQLGESIAGLRVAADQFARGRLESLGGLPERSRARGSIESGCGSFFAGRYKSILPGASTMRVFRKLGFGASLCQIT